MNSAVFWILSVKYLVKSSETESYAVGIYGVDDQTLLQDFAIDMIIDANNVLQISVFKDGQSVGVAYS